MLMIKNFGSQPKINCNIITDAVMIIGFLYFINTFFMISNTLLPGYSSLLPFEEEQ